MAQGGFLVSRDFVQRASRAIRKSEHDPATGATRRRITWESGFRTVCGQLTSAITPASPDGKTGSTTFTFREWIYDTADTHDPQYRTDAAADSTGVNRSQMSADAGRYVICLQVGNELQPIWTDC